MHYLPGPIFWPKDHRSPQGVWGYVLPSAYLALAPLYLHHAGKLRDYVLRHDLVEIGAAQVVLGVWLALKQHQDI
jgi:hypothetical protein